MADKSRPSSRGRRPAKDAPPVAVSGAASDEEFAAVAEIQGILGIPLPDLATTPEERAATEEVVRQARSAPAMARLREVVAFVGKGRPATQAGNLKAGDAVALSRRLATGERVPAEMRAMDDLPDTAHDFRWAAAAEFLVRRATKVVAGTFAPELERDPLAAWFKAAMTLLEHGPLDGFRPGWRKSYVEYLDANAAGLLVGLGEAGGAVALTTIEAQVWQDVAEEYGYEPDDDRERRHVSGLVEAMVEQFRDLGVMDRRDDEVVLSELGLFLAALVAVATEVDLDDSDLDDLDLDDLDLVDTDAQSLLLVCAEQQEWSDVSGHLLAWCQGRSAEEAVEELCAAILDDDDPEVWKLGLEAMGMIERAVAVPAVRALRAHRGVRPMADVWLRRHGARPRPPASR